MDALRTPTPQEAVKFGTDGWRGLIADQFTFHNLRRVAEAAAKYFFDHCPTKERVIYIGYDRRFLSPEFARCVGIVLKQKGLDVRITSQPIPTPALSVCITRNQIPWGIMITASHNPAEYNGFKIKDSYGRSAPSEITSAIEGTLPSSLSEDSISSTDINTFDYTKDYFNYLNKRLDLHAIKRLKKRVIFDYLYGVAAGIPENLLKGGSAKLFSLHATHDATFGGLHPEPILPYLSELQKEVKNRRAVVGLAFDGDADRLGVIDDHGTYLTPHQVFPLLIYYAIQHKGWKGKIVQSVSLGALGPRIAQEFGLPFEEVPVGFKHIAERMIKEPILAGGEESGGYAFYEGIPERDGILNGLFFLEMIATTGKSPSQLVKEMESRFGSARFKRKDILLKEPIWDKRSFTERILSKLPDRIAGQKITETRPFDGLKIICENQAWVLLRPSGTEPLLRTYAESASWQQTDKLLEFAAHIIKEQTS